MKEIRSRGRPRAFDRDAALLKAMTLFWERGYEATSLTDLTEAMGIAPASLYAAFDSKEQLFYEATRKYGELHGGVDREMVERASARELVAGLLRGAAKAFTEPKLPRGCMVLSSTTNCSDASVEATMRKQRLDNERLITDAFKRAAANGQLARNVDPLALSKLVITLFQGMSFQAREGATRAQLTAIADLAIALVDDQLRS